MDLLGRCFDSLFAAWPWSVAMVCISAFAIVADRWRQERIPQLIRWLPRFALAASLLGGSYRVLRDAWLADDAFISFRYAQHFAEGLGLVWNPGERVEGYTNFLFTFALGVGRLLRADIPTLALVFDFAAYLAIVALAVLIVRSSRSIASEKSALPFAAIVLALARPLTTFATSGLETLVATALVLFAMYLVGRRAAPIAVGVVLALAAMTRPDHAVFIAGAMLAYLPSRPRRLSELSDAIRVGAAFIVVFGTFWALRAAYYGDFVPNTFRAKSGASAYWGQGGLYLVHFLLTTWTFTWLPLGGAALVLNLRGRRAGSGPSLRRFALVGSALLTLYVVRVGGDFMEHRFLITPFVCCVVIAELEVRAWVDSLRARSASVRMQIVAGASIAILLVSAMPIRPIGPMQKVDGLAAEESFYRLSRVGVGGLMPVYPLRVDCGYEDWSERLLAAFADSPAKPVLAYGSIGILGYRTGFPIVDVMGLTDRRIASRPVLRRGRPGHEREASLADLHAAGSYAWLDAPGSDNFPFARIDIAGLPALLLSTRPASLSTLRAGGVEVPDFATGVAELAAEPSRDVRLLGRDFARILLDGHADASRLLSPLDASLGSLAEFEEPVSERALGRDARWIPADSVPAGQGAGALEIGAEGRVELPLPSGLSELRLRAATTHGRSHRLRVEDVGGVLLERILPSAPSIVALQLPRPTRVGARVVFEGASVVGARAYVDSLHRPAPDEADWARDALASDDPAAYAHFLLRMSDELPPSDPRWRAWSSRAARFVSFDSALLEPGDRATGDAFGLSTRMRLPEQARVRGMLGVGYASGYVRGDSAVGTLVLPLGTRGPALVAMRIAGGADCSRLRVEVRADNTALATECAAGDERFRTAIVRIPTTTESALELQVVDESAGAWGHLLVDQVVAISLAGQR